MGLIEFKFKLKTNNQNVFPNGRYLIDTVASHTGLMLDFKTLLFQGKLYDNSQICYSDVVKDMFRLRREVKEIDIHIGAKDWGYLWWCCLYKTACLVVSLGGGGVCINVNKPLETILLFNEQDIEYFMLKCYVDKDFYKYPYHIAKDMDGFIYGEVSKKDYQNE